MSSGAFTEAQTLGGRSRPWFSWPGSAASSLLFLVIPIIFVIAVSRLTDAKGPQWLPSTFENPYNYLFNSLLVLEGRAPTYTDHPGTTTEMFGAIILRISSLKMSEDLIYSALSHPEKQIQELHWALLIFSALILWILPWLTALALRSNITGLLIQAPSLFFKTLVFYGILFGSDLMLVPFSVAAVCCSVLQLVPSAVPEKLEFFFAIRTASPDARSPRLRRLPVLLLPALMGLVCAFGMATKLTFFPLVLISLLCCRNRNNLLVFTITFIFGLAFALLPICWHLWRLVNWALGLGIHSGVYATGEIGLPQSKLYLSSLSNLVQTDPLILTIPTVVTVLLLTFSLLARRTSATKITWKIAFALFAIQVLALLAVAKEMSSHYLIPLFISTGLSLVLLFQTCRNIDSSKLTKAVGWIGLFVLLALGTNSFVSETSKTLAELQKQKVELLRLYSHAEEVTKNDVRVDYFFSDSPFYPLCYGNDYADRAFGQLLARMYPNALFLNVFGDPKFESFTEFIDPEVELQKHDHLYFLGNRNFFPKMKGFDLASMETIDHAGDYYLQKWTRKVSP